MYDQARAAAEETSEERMEFLFSLFDQDGDGDISMEEFMEKMKEVCTTLTDSELAAVCRDCDKVC
jgi:Ca2+-binding EF-hand superfamily protein|eukprot:COSAG06_NODE_1405_length_9554_cov_8.206557_6_plen_65_part_00